MSFSPLCYPGALKGYICISHQGITFIPGILYAIRQRLLLRLYKTINTDQLFQAIFYNIPVETKEMRNASQKKIMSNIDIAINNMFHIYQRINTGTIRNTHEIYGFKWALIGYLDNNEIRPTLLSMLVVFDDGKLK